MGRGLTTEKQPSEHGERRYVRLVCSMGMRSQGRPSEVELARFRVADLPHAQRHIYCLPHGAVFIICVYVSACERVSF